MKQLSPSSKRWILISGVLLPLAIFLLLVVSPFHMRKARSEDLASLIDKADKLVVVNSPQEMASVVFESTDRKDLDALKSAIKVKHPQSYVHCMCDGTPAVMLYSKGAMIGQITNHHAQLIRCSIWESDATLVDVEAFLKWFDTRQIPGPRKELELNLKLRNEENEAEQKWVAAMPDAIKPLWSNARRSVPIEPAPFRKAFTSPVTEMDDRILALFSWYGSGVGLWSGYPVYEDIAETLLLDYQTPELLAAIEGKNSHPRRLREWQDYSAAGPSRNSAGTILNCCRQSSRWNCSVIVWQATMKTSEPEQTECSVKNEPSTLTPAGKSSVAVLLSRRTNSPSQREIARTSKRGAYVAAWAVNTGGRSFLPAAQ